jgi:hypothetical protein
MQIFERRLELSNLSARSGEVQLSEQLDEKAGSLPDEPAGSFNF